MIVTHEGKGRVPPRLPPSDALRFVPEVRALVDAATAAAEYMLDSDLCDADKEWRIGDGLRAALAPFEAPECTPASPTPERTVR